MTYILFGSAADRYDWHTPPYHYQDDHAFVLSRLTGSKRILDVGCGTGVLLEKGIAAGFDMTGFDVSPEMMAIAARRAGNGSVYTARMQEFSEINEYDAIVSLSWSFNYVASNAEARQVLARFFAGLKPGGKLIIQIAHAPNAYGNLNEDREPGPEGQPDDVLFLYRFYSPVDSDDELVAQYVYGCKSRGDLIFEEHRLRAANAYKVAEEAKSVGFEEIEVLDSWRGEALDKSISAFLMARRP
jgi:SAM-dependent methyltransferase